MAGKNLDVGICVEVLNIWNLSTLGESFDIRFKVTLLYQGEALLDPSQQNPFTKSWYELCPEDDSQSKISQKEYYAKKLFGLFSAKQVQSVLEEHPATTKTARALVPAEVWLAQKVFCVTIREPLELQNFPVDAQRLPLQVGLDHPRFHLVCPDAFTQKLPMLKITQTAFGLSGFYAREPEIQFTKCQVDGVKTIDVVMVFKAVRDVGPFLYRYIVVLALLMSTTLGVFAIEPTEVADRLGYLMTLLLTAVAYILMVSSMIPNVPYLTLLDKYVFVMFAIIFATLMECGLYEPWQLTPTSDRHFFYALVSVIIAIQILFAGLAVAFRKDEVSKLSTPQEEERQDRKDVILYGPKDVNNQSQAMPDLKPYRHDKDPS